MLLSLGMRSERKLHDDILGMPLGRVRHYSIENNVAQSGICSSLSRGKCKEDRGTRAQKVPSIVQICRNPLVQQRASGTDSDTLRLVVLSSVPII